jgi:hypothetical protein
VKKRIPETPKITVAKDLPVLFKAFEKQEEFMRAVLSGDFKYLLYGGAIRGGKSYVTLAIIIILAKLFPRSRWAIVRKDFPTIRRNLLPTFEKIAPRPFIGKFNWASLTYPCANGSEIVIFPEQYAPDKELNRWRGLEVNGFDFEEANELQEDSFNKAIERAGSWIVPGGGEQPKPIILLTCNPNDGWVKKKFYTPWAAGALVAPFFYLPANIFDNPYIPQDYIDSLKNLPDHLYRKFVLGDWTVSDDPLQIIPYQDLHERIIKSPEELVQLMEMYRGQSALGVDVGELGNDKTSLVHFMGPVLYEVEQMFKKRTDEIAGIIQVRMSERDIAAENVAIDAIGVGAGVWGNLKGAGHNVNRIIAGASVQENLRTDETKSLDLIMKNLKTQMWWKARQDVLSSESEFRLINHAGVLQDLTSVHYRIIHERTIEVEPKDKTIQRLGRSPDDGDAAVMGNFVRTQPYISGAARDDEPKMKEDGSEMTDREAREETMREMREPRKRAF